MRVFPFCLVLGMLALGVALPAAAQPVATKHIEFHQGFSGAVISDTVRGTNAIDYILKVQGGQRLVVDMTADNINTYFNLIGPYSGAAAHVGTVAGPYFTGVLPTDGEWTIRVYLMRSAAHRGEEADFDLSLHIGDANAATFAPLDDVGHGPDYWRVVDTASIGYLNIRSGPGFGHRVMARVPNGSLLRNLGCTGSGLGRWCHVQSAADDIDGWSYGARLAESGAPVERDLATLIANNGGGAVLYEQPTREFEVQWQSGCTVNYSALLDRVGEVGTCSEIQLATSDRWINEQRPRY